MGQPRQVEENCKHTHKGLPFAHRKCPGGSPWGQYQFTKEQSGIGTGPRLTSSKMDTENSRRPQPSSSLGSFSPSKPVPCTRTPWSDRVTRHALGNVAPSLSAPWVWLPRFTGMQETAECWADNWGRWSPHWKNPDPKNPATSVALPLPFHPQSPNYPPSMESRSNVLACVQLQIVVLP